MLLYLVPASDAEIDTALANKGRDIGGGEEDQGNWEVLDESNVETVLAAELDVGTLEEVECSGIESSLWRLKLLADASRMGGQLPHGYILLGTAKRRRPSRLEHRIISMEAIDSGLGARSPYRTMARGAGETNLLTKSMVATKGECTL